MSSNAIQRAKPAATVFAAITTAQIFAELNSNPLIPAILPCPGSSRLEGKRFKVNASGTVTTAGAFTAFPSLYAALVTPVLNPFTPASWTLLGAGTATAVGTTSAGWDIEADLMFDSLSGFLIGEYTSNANNIFVARAAITNRLGGVVGSNEPALVFAVGLTFNSANAANIGRLADFCLDC